MEELLRDIPIPDLLPIRQQFDAPEVTDLEQEVLGQLERSKIIGSHLHGKRIAIGVGSRGISRIADVTRFTVEALLAHGAVPFVIPAMGSHGGATAEGQLDVLASLGVTEQAIGAPICSSLDVVEVGRLNNGLPVYIDRMAYEHADGIMVINRIKPHTAFRGRYESGLIKMITIGLGKQKGAQACHAYSFAHMAEHLPAMAHILADAVPILGGIGIIENAYDRIAEIHAFTVPEMFEREPALLVRAKSLMPRLFADEIDVLIVDEIGKNISGDGMDPNITGRYPTPYASGGPTVRRLIVLSLTAETHGNANGIGMADITTRRLLGQLDEEKGYMNALTSTVLDSVRLPMVLSSDRRAIQAAIATCNARRVEDVRVMRIRNTLTLDTVWVSPALATEGSMPSWASVSGTALPWTFTEEGNLISLG